MCKKYQVLPEDNFIFYTYNGLLTTAPKSFVGLSERDRADLYNGCGAGRIGGKLTPESLLGLKITYLCQIHDHMYERCCCERDEEIADGIFVMNMNNWISGHSSNVATALSRFTLMSKYMYGVSTTIYSREYWEINRREIGRDSRYTGIYSLEL